MIKYCPECGNKLLDDKSKFCPECGKKIVITNNIEQQDKQILQTPVEDEKPVYSTSIGSYKIRKKNSKTAKVGVIISVVIISLILASIFLPWYAVDLKWQGSAQSSDVYADVNLDFNIFFSLSEAGYETKGTITSNGITQDYEDSSKSGYTSGGSDEGLNNLMNVTFFLTVITILIAIILIIVFFAFLYDKIGRISVIIIFIILFACTFIATTYFAISSPSVMKSGLIAVGESAETSTGGSFDIFYKYNSFIGFTTDTVPWSSVSSSMSGASGYANVYMGWYPSVGWFFMLISSILSIVGICFAIFKKN